MTFTALHRAVGAAPGPLTDQLLDDAVAAGVMETDDLDWKRELPPMKGLPLTDFPKDVAAMANSGGGLIVYGVEEVQKAASGRVDVSDVDEKYERSLLSATITAISPPVFGVKVHRLSTGGKRAAVIEVPASVDGPHLIYKDQFFGAPVRNGADTVWMKERQIEAMYRARFEERRHAAEALDALFSDASAGRDNGKRAWLIAVAHPRVPNGRERLSRDRARLAFSEAAELTPSYARVDGNRPLENVDRLNPCPGLRRWVARNTAISTNAAWREAWASIHWDGSVTLAVAVGAHRSGRDTYLEGWEVDCRGIERAVADFMALVRATAEATGNEDYDVRIGISWTGISPLMILANDSGYASDRTSIPLHRYTPVESTVNAAEANPEFHRHVHDLALDCVNQGGVSDVCLIRLPAPQNEA
ncbi:hypothetical protein Ais01nite_21760 [Asanoa ishikariensis]|uniref:Putative DNA-binding domain-containing protein n=1 Tax=Asanoa ishikariensis TaxID=137265 RepID=A0A1H3U7E4_9ACTN|nr:ATP-binding protein [Asanoa ishikariensis]GIF64141.1 hypothetical protein Ais01nite_21760 [Asanoa ishikariensis]SDZ58350.1 Putative DNA-binding domain-containing protein [Asanoa ishikariensis]